MGESLPGLEYDDGEREMTWEELDRYNEQVQKSGGFDVEDFGKVCNFHQIIPQNPDLEIYDEYVKMAIKYYNKRKRANIKFVELEKVNSQVVRGVKFYITFKAIDRGETKTFQAIVIMHPGDEGREVLSCELKPMPGKNGDDVSYAELNCPSKSSLPVYLSLILMFLTVLRRLGYWLNRLA